MRGPLPVPLAVALALVAPAIRASAAETAPAPLPDAAVLTARSVSGAAPGFGVDALAGRAGPVGLPGMSTAEVGPAGSLRLGLSGEYFRASNFLVSAAGSSGDRNTRVRGAVTVSGTPLPFLELFAGLSGAANRNRRICGAGEASETCSSESGRMDPEVIRTSAALALGTKLGLALPAGWAVGGELGVRLWPSLGGVAFDPQATSGWLDALAGLDLRAVAGLPLRVHLGAGFLLDNSYNLRDGAGELPSARLVSAFAHGLGRERLRTALALDAPWREPWGGRLVRPSLEYHAEVVTAEPDPLFADMPSADDNRDQHWLTAGLALQGRGGSALGLAVDVALRSPGFAHGPRLPTVSFALTFSQALDLAAPTLVTRIVERPVPAPPREGQVRGRVLGPEGTAIDGALVAIEGRPQSRVATDPDGTFRARGLTPGPQALLVRAPGFEEVRLPTTVVAGGEAEVAVTLAWRQYPITGRLADSTGAGVRGTMRLLEGEAPELAVDDSGAFTLHLRAGRHRARVDADGFLSHVVSLEVREDGRVRLMSQPEGERVDLTLRPRPPVARVSFADGVGQFAVPFPFATGAVDLSPEALALLDELVDALLRRETARRVRIECHWDRGLPEDEAQRLTEEHAQAVVRHLVARGIDERQLEPAGLGRSRPLPGQPRSRQRRLEIHELLP